MLTVNFTTDHQSKIQKKNASTKNMLPVNIAHMNQTTGSLNSVTLQRLVFATMCTCVYAEMCICIHDWCSAGFAFGEGFVDLKNAFYMKLITGSCTSFLRFV